MRGDFILEHSSCSCTCAPMGPGECGPGWEFRDCVQCLVRAIPRLRGVRPLNRSFGESTWRSCEQGLRFWLVPRPPAWAGSELAEPRLASEPQGGREPRACGRAWRANSRVMDASSASAIYLPRFFFFLPPAELIRKVFFWRTVYLFSLSLSFLGLVRCCSHHSSRFSRVSSFALFST